MSDAFSYSVVREQAIVPLVSCLLNTGGPAAILWAISRVVVSSFEAVLRSWPVSNIRYEVLESVPSAPPVANRNSARAVILESGSGLAMTSCNHLAPHGPKWMASICSSQFTRQAAAAFSNSPDERTRRDISLLSALTPASPENKTPPILYAINDSEPSKRESGKVNHSSGHCICVEASATSYCSIAKRSTSNNGRISALTHAVPLCRLSGFWSKRHCGKSSELLARDVLGPLGALWHEHIPTLLTP